MIPGPPEVDPATSGGPDPYKPGGFPPGYPPDIRTYYAPVDDVHGAILAQINSAQTSLIVAMYAWADPLFQAAILAKIHDANVAVQLTLDSSQAIGVPEKTLLAAWNAPGTSIAVGTSEKGAFMHLKCLVVDNQVLVTGSTNWSASGERRQDNACLVITDPYVAAEATTRIAAIHAAILAATPPK